MFLFIVGLTHYVKCQPCSEACKKTILKFKLFKNKGVHIDTNLIRIEALKS